MMNEVNQDNSLLRHTFQNRVLLFAFFLSAFYEVILILFNNNALSIITTFFCTLFFLLLYCLSRFTKKTELIGIIFYFSTLLMFCVSWILMSGLNSGNGFFFLMGIAIFSIILPDKFFVVSLCITLITITLLYFIEYNDWIYIYKNLKPSELQLTNLINLISSIILASMALHIIILQYEKQRQLNQQKKEDLKQSNNVKSLFVSNFSHELRTPLNGIIGISELLMESAHNKEQKEYIDNIQNSGKELLQIINNTLNFAKIESGKDKVINTPFNLRHLLIETADFFKIKASAKGLKFYIDIDDHLFNSVIGDQYKLNAVLYNILDNAIKFTNKGSIILKVDHIMIDNQKVQFIFSIQDSGIGISEGDIHNIFDPFTKIINEKLVYFKGIGLGLTLSKYYIEKMNGKLNVISDPENGSTFKFSIILNTSANQNGVNEDKSQ